MYSSPSLIRTCLPPNKTILIREVSFGEREDLRHTQCLMPNSSVLKRVVSF